MEEHATRGAAADSMHSDVLGYKSTNVDPIQHRLPVTWPEGRTLPIVTSAESQNFNNDQPAYHQATTPPSRDVIQTNPDKSVTSQLFV